MAYRVDRLGPLHCDPSRKDGVRATLTPEGYLRAIGRLTRSGVFNYQDELGNEWAEWRPESEISDPAHLSSFELQIITNNHPDEMVSAASAAEHQIGTVGSHVYWDGTYVVADMVITDPSAISAIQKGKVELSCGYNVEVTDEIGIDPVEGIPYQRVQRSPRGNHVALVDEGRAGPQCKLSFDGVSKMKKDKSKKDATVMVAEVPYEVADEVAAEMARLAEMAAESGVLPMVDAEGDPVAEEPMVPPAAEPVAEPAAEEPPKMDHAQVARYITLRDSAKAILPSGSHLDSDPDAMRRAVVYHVMPSMKGSLDSASAAVLDGAYRVAVAAHRKNKDSKEALMRDSFDGARPVQKTAVDAFDAMIAKRNKTVGGK